jgi:hypothetical protein
MDFEVFVVYGVSPRLECAAEAFGLFEKAGVNDLLDTVFDFVGDFFYHFVWIGHFVGDDIVYDVLDVGI